MVSMRLKRFGSKKRPDYRIVVIDSREKRQGRAIEEVGHYHPLAEKKEEQLVIKEDRVKEWLMKGAQPSDTVRNLLNKSGVQVNRKAQD